MFYISELLVQLSLQRLMFMLDNMVSMHNILEKNQFFLFLKTKIYIPLERLKKTFFLSQLFFTTVVLFYPGDVFFSRLESLLLEVSWICSRSNNRCPDHERKSCFLVIEQAGYFFDMFWRIVNVFAPLNSFNVCSFGFS